MHAQRTIYRVVGRAAAAILLAVALCAPSAMAYTGMLISTGSGILGSGNWIAGGPTSMAWNVTQNPNDTWHYEYVFSHPRGDTSHFILEAAEGFGWDDILDPGGDYGLMDIGWQTAGSGNPTMPAEVYGIRFDQAWGLTSLFEFDSFRAPAWGDFYSTSSSAGGFGVINSAWNAGFGLTDVDPVGPASDGSLQSHALVPHADATPPPIPEPSALLLLGTALIGMIAVRRMRA